MKISLSFIPLVAGLAAFGLGSCSPNASTTVQNARIEEQLKNIQNALAQPAAKNSTEKDLQEIKLAVDDIRKTTSALSEAVTALKSGQDSKPGNEALVQEIKALIEPMQKQIAELGTKVGQVASAAPAAGPSVARENPPANPNPNPAPRPQAKPNPRPDNPNEINVLWPEERGGGGRTQPSNRGGGRAAPRPADGPINMPNTPGVVPTPGNAGAGPGGERASEIIDVRWPEERR